MKYRWLFHHKTFYFVPHCIHVYSSNKTFKNLVECQSCPEGFYSVMNMCSCCKFQHRAYKSYSSRLMNVLILVATERKVVSANPRCLEDTGIGGVGTQIWFRRGCAAEAAKPVPIFKGHFGGKGYPLIRVFSQENDVFVYFSDKKGENI